MKLFVIFCSLFIGMSSASAQQLPYRDARLSVEERLSDLMQRMTLEEKIGQLRCAMAWNY